MHLSIICRFFIYICLLKVIFPLSLQPCDLLYDTSDLYIQNDCQHQQIDNTKTIYSWETSTDGGSSFNTVSASTIFTSPYSRVLQTLYLAPGVFVRCRVQAVDHSGRKGYWRESEAVRTGEKKYSCYGDDEEEEEGSFMTATLTSYESYRASDQVCE